MKRILIAGLILFLTVSLSAQTKKSKIKIFISVDMEGITGVVDEGQLIPGNPEYELARKWMAEDVNAVIEGAVKGGASEIIVNDAYGSMRNINPDDLNPRAVLISGWPKPMSMMQGIDSSFDACLFVGYHAMAGTRDAVLDSTFSRSAVRSIKVNGTELPELGVNAALAGIYGVPVVFISGDVAVCKQAKIVLGEEVVTAPVKDGITRYAARLVPAVDARRAMRERAADAVRRAKQFKPFRLNSPYAFELEFFTPVQADRAVFVPQVTRKDARTVSFSLDDFLQGFRLIQALVTLVDAQ